MTKLHTTIPLLKAAWQEDGAGEKIGAHIEKLEKVTWAIKRPAQDYPLGLDVIVATEGIRFALWALRAAAQPQAACRAGRLIAIDMALAGCELFKNETGLPDYAPKLQRLREMVAEDADLSLWRDYAALVGSFEESAKLDSWHSEVLGLLATAVRSVFAGGDFFNPDGDWSLGGLYGPESGFNANTV